MKRGEASRRYRAGAMLLAALLAANQLVSHDGACVAPDGVRLVGNLTRLRAGHASANHNAATARAANFTIAINAPNPKSKYVWSDGVSAEISARKAWEPNITLTIARELHEARARLSGARPTFLDVGANLGWFTLYMAATMDVDVIAVEPRPRNAAMINASLCINRAAERLRGTVALHQVGASDRSAVDASCRLVSPPFNVASTMLVCGNSSDSRTAAGGLADNHDGARGLDNQDVDKWARSVGLKIKSSNRYVTDHAAGAQGGAPAPMRLSRLDELVTRPVDVLKIDTEGHARGASHSRARTCMPRMHAHADVVASVRTHAH